MAGKAQVVKECDVLVVGGGCAGCMAAITAKASGVEKVILVDKGKVSRSGQSTFVAGGWALFLPGDDLHEWIKETVVLGEYLNDQEWVRLLWEKIYPVTAAIDGWGRELNKEVFKKNQDGSFYRAKERGHIKTYTTVVFSVPMMEVLRAKAIAMGVEIMDRVMICELLATGGRFSGAVGFGIRSEETYLFKARAVVLAAAGAGFKSIFIGHRNLTGDLQAAAYRAGVNLVNLENMSHNTCARRYDIHGLGQFVGMGGKWVNSEGREFMWDYDPVLGNRANLQTLCLAFAREMHVGRGPIMMDLTAISPENQRLLEKLIPQTIKVFTRAGIDPFREKIEWTVSFYGTIISGGGIHIDTNCAATVPGIYAAGDITSIPPHGTYSFAGVNIAFCAVSGVVAGERVAEFVKNASEPEWTKDFKDRADAGIEEMLRPLLIPGMVSPDQVISDVQRAVIPYRVSLIKSQGSLEEALARITATKEKLLDVKATDFHELVKAHEATNLATLAELMIRASLFRKESRGFHFREDYPLTDNRDWLKWILVKEEKGEARFWTEKIPTPYLSPPADYERPKGLRQK